MLLDSIKSPLIFNWPCRLGVMKDKIIAFIKSVKLAFSSRRSRMPTARFHRPFIQELATDESRLENASITIAKLDDSNQKLFAASILYYLMELVVPIFRNWMNRIKKLPEGHNEGHLIASAEYEKMKTEFQALLLEANKFQGGQFIVIDDAYENPAIAIVKSYKKETYLIEHKIQELNEPENITTEERMVAGYNV